VPSDDVKPPVELASTTELPVRTLVGKVNVFAEIATASVEFAVIEILVAFETKPPETRKARSDPIPYVLLAESTTVVGSFCVLNSAQVLEAVSRYRPVYWVTVALP
jgi:hypothetical protein